MNGILDPFPWLCPPLQPPSPWIYALPFPLLPPDSTKVVNSTGVCLYSNTGILGGHYPLSWTWHLPSGWAAPL